MKIKKYQDTDRESLIAVWAKSVLATHHFLKPEDFEFYRAIVNGIDFTTLDVYCAFDETESIAAFLAVAGGKLEMLFVRPESIGKGIGKHLIQFALDKLQVTQVDVNEANILAVAFYKKCGFIRYDRLAVDDCGKPYPILKMKL